MCLDKESIDPYRRGRTRQWERKFRLPRRFLPRASRKLQRVGSIKNDRQTGLLHDQQTTEINHQIAESKRRAETEVNPREIKSHDELARYYFA